MKKGNLNNSKENIKPSIKLNRRTFLKFSAITGAVIGANQILGQSNSNNRLPLLQETTPKNLKERWITTSCLNCSGRCAIQVKVMNGKAVKVTGNPYSFDSEGKVCPRAHIGLQVLYDPERIGTPLKRTNSEKGKGIDPKWVPIAWNQALEEITNKLKKLREMGEPQKLLLFYGLNTIATEDLIIRFAESFGTPNIISGDGLDNETEKMGNWMADGNSTHTAYDFDHTNYILAFGSDMLESSRPLSRFLRKWGRFRREKPNRTKVIVISPRYSITSAKADEWIPINPGSEGVLAMAISYVILRDELYDRGFIKDWTVGFDSYKRLVLNKYTPENVSKITGIEPQTIQRIAREFATTRPSIAFRGKEATNWPDGSYRSYAIYCLNALVGSIDIPGGVIYQENPEYKPMPQLVEDQIAKKGNLKPIIDLRGTDKFPGAKTVTNQIPESISEGIPYPIDMAIGFNSNFNMIAPAPQRWEKALKKIPYYVHISPFISEMALHADIVLPSTVFLEEWGYDHSQSGSGFMEIKLKQPVVTPYANSRPIIDILFEIAKRLGGSLSRSFQNIGDNGEGFVKYRTEKFISWSEFLKKGVIRGKRYEYKKYGRIFHTPSKKFEFSSGNLRSLIAKIKKDSGEIQDYFPQYKETKFLGDKNQYPFVLIPYQPLMVFENGSQNYPWAQEIFLPMHGVGWETLIEINSEMAKTLKFKDGQMVWVESPFSKIKAKVKLSEGIHPYAVAIPSGQGHYSYGRWQKGIGSNPNEVIGIDYDRISGQSVFFNTRVRIYRA